MNYKRLFDPELFPHDALAAPLRADAGRADAGTKDDRDSGAADPDDDSGFVDRSGPYVYFDDRLVLAINVALATHRPLVLRGAPGCGKSALAQDVARRIGASYFPQVVTSRTQAQDLQWRFDAIRRLADAQARGHSPAESSDAALLERYIVPGVLWWAFDEHSARRRGLPGNTALPFVGAEPPGPIIPDARAVILLDEIDKAEPEVPNDLLVALGALQFVVTETNHQVTAARQRPPLIILTSNDERELPEAFLRRCIVLPMQVPDTVKMLRIASAHFPQAPGALLQQIGARFEHIREYAEVRNLRIPGTAEFLDTVRACLELEVTADSDVWSLLTETTLWKPAQGSALDGSPA